MSIEQARAILQEEAADLTDGQILDLIQNTGNICDGILDVLVKQHLTQKKKEAYYG